MEAIIAKLKAMPNRDISHVALALKMPTMDVSRAQHEYLKQFRVSK
ncbi:hypothetical protein [Sphingobacterium yanglingense]|uniref:Uncharacterized protein n=1 Tax=Sphingobacterium yanglingense TaxID=1437280 RepID=A0A4R6WKS0_9SPHI|nr:hypothetical protein [Sphingobacterium yanglingense]TDQ79537.1 hypothetical protein CLV99_0979 [Sphingobacterium yanglingense]